MQRVFLTLATATAFTVASTATVLAADMTRPVYKAPPPMPALYSWTGFYVGIHGGGARFDKDWFYPCTATNLLLPPCNLAQGGHSGTSWLAGGQVGFNYQVGQWVLPS
jgi:outer membrane immunogenic protein